jgi:hypothetical protein
MLTNDEVKLAAHAFALRHDETDTDLWFAPADRYFTEACRLWARGYLDRKWHNGELIYRYSDKALTAQRLAGLHHTSRN